MRVLGRGWRCGDPNPCFCPHRYVHALSEGSAPLPGLMGMAMLLVIPRWLLVSGLGGYWPSRVLRTCGNPTVRASCGVLCYFLFSPRLPQTRVPARCGPVVRFVIPRRLKRKL